MSGLQTFDAKNWKIDEFACHVKEMGRILSSSQKI